MTRLSIATSFACALAIGSTAVAVLPADAAAPVARVRYADLDLGSAAGQRTLAHRLNGAVSLVCPTETGDFRAREDCRRAALDAAHADLRKAGVAAF